MKPNLTALIRSAIGTIWFVVIATIGGELSAPFKNFFVTVGRHHWTGKSIIAGAVFALLYLIFLRGKESRHPERGIHTAAASAITGGVLIFGFFVWHYFGL